MFVESHVGGGGAAPPVHADEGAVVLLPAAEYGDHDHHDGDDEDGGTHTNTNNRLHGEELKQKEIYEYAKLKIFESAQTGCFKMQLLSAVSLVKTKCKFFRNRQKELLKW